MFVRVDVGAGRAELCDAEDLKGLRVDIVGGQGGEGDADEAARALGELGHLDGEHAWLRIGALRAAGPSDPAWQQQFDAMIDYARTKGWTDGAGSVRAHVERPAR